MTSSKPPAGMVDQVGPAAERFEHTVTQLRTAFRRFGLEPVMPPVIERAEHFLDRSGEDLRSRLYLFTDPGGREICLRPELTIPTVRLYADQLKGDGRPLRGYYIGPVFRYDTRSEGRYRQFTQAGAELIGDQDVAMADVESVALALHALEACGLDNLRVAVSDISFFTSLLEEAALPPKLMARLRSLATNPRKLRTFLDEQLASDRHGNGSERDDVLKNLGAVDPSLRRELVGDLVRSVQPTALFGSRSLEDIVTRTLEQADVSGTNRLPRPLAQALRELLTIELPLPAGLRAVADIAKHANGGDGGEADRLQHRLAEWDRKLALLSAFGIDPSRVHLDLKVGRGIDYYSSFVFEITSGANNTNSASGAGGTDRTDTDQLCAGGRYDDLVQNLSGRPGVPAVGFAIGVERVLLAQGPPTAADQAKPLQPPDVLVVAGGDVAETDVVRATTALRSHGLAAVHLPGRRVRYGLAQALKLGVRHLAIVGEREAEEALITIRNLDQHDERSLAIADAVTFIRDGGDEESGGADSAPGEGGAP